MLAVASGAILLCQNMRLRHGSCSDFVDCSALVIGNPRSLIFPTESLTRECVHLLSYPVMMFYKDVG